MTVYMVARFRAMSVSMDLLVNLSSRIPVDRERVSPYPPNP